MKAIISSALVLGLLTVSCKKETQTTTPITTDTSVSDSMNSNSTRPDTAGITSKNTNDSVTTIKMNDSTRVNSK